ncbi:MAG: G5 domain-containing protein [Armatimonadota bacterium]
MDKEYQILQLRRQLLIERLAFGAVVLGLIGWWAYGRFVDTKAFIVVNGKPLVCLGSEKDARDVLQQLKAQHRCRPSEVEFKEDVVIARAPRDVRPVSRHKAMRAVRQALSPVVPKWAIIVNGKPIVALASRKDAGEVLDLARLKFGKLAKNLAEEPQFKEKVAVDIAAVDPAIYRKTPQEALAYIFETPQAQPQDAIYVVKRGDLAGQIAARFGLKLEDIWELNPGKNLNRLQIGDQIRVRRVMPAPAKLTVVVRDLRERVERIPPPVHRVSSAKMYLGKSVEISPGRPGLRRVKLATVYENGRKVGSEVLEEEIIREPAPRTIAEGIKPRSPSEYSTGHR